MNMTQQTISAGLSDAARLYGEGRYAEARDAARARLRQQPDDATALSVLGAVAIKEHDFGAAIEHLSAALEVAPDLAMAHFNMGWVYITQGQFEEARHHYREALRLEPGNAQVYEYLSACGKTHDPDDPLLREVLEQLQGAATASPQACHLHFAAAKIYDDLRDHERAFAHYRAANDAKGLRYDGIEDRQQLAGILTNYRPDQPQANASADAGAGLIFVVGMPRSGTSLVEQILASHSAGVLGAGELPDIAAIAAAMAQRLGCGRYPDYVGQLSEAVLTGYGQAYLQRLRERFPQVGAMVRVVDKNPLNFWFVGLIRQMFPAARLVHTRRDPVDTCLSCFFQNFSNGHAYAFDLETLGRYYALYRGAMAHWQQLYPEHILELDYEALVDDPRGQIERLLGFCGLPWDDACLQHQDTDRAVGTASNWQVRQPLYRRSVQRWRRYQQHLGPLLEALRAGGVAVETP